MMKPWGLLGEPTQEQIEEWKNMPYGKFKAMTETLRKKSKGKVLKKHAVEIKMIDEVSTSSFVYVQAFDIDHAIEQAKNINKSEIAWSEPKKEPTKTLYRVSQIW